MGDEGGNCGVEAVENYNAVMMIRGNNHARHSSEFIAANFREHIKHTFGIGLVDFKGASNDFNFVSKFFIINIRAATGNFFRLHVQISGSHCGGNSRIGNSHFTEQKTITARLNSLLRQFLADTDGFHCVLKSHCGTFSDIFCAARNFSVDKSRQM